MAVGVIADLARHAEPHVAFGIFGLGVHIVAAPHDAAFHGLGEWRIEAIRMPVGQFLPVLEVRLQLLGGRDLGHRRGVVQAVLHGLIRHRGNENRLAVLFCHHAARGEAAPVASRVDFKHDLLAGIARAQKVRVHGVCDALSVDRAVRGIQTLREDLPAKHPAGAPGAGSRKQKGIDPLDFKAVQQLCKGRVHVVA